MKPGGSEIRKLFHQTDEVAMLNHGAYGLSPSTIIKKRLE